jgi:5,10-methylenetetrahydrofolate reductase
VSDSGAALPRHAAIGYHRAGVFGTGTRPLAFDIAGSMDFGEKLIASRDFIYLYGTTPPRAGAEEERVAGAATKLAARVKSLPLDGIVVYDVQDESERTDEPRPFPFLPTLDSRRYARLLGTLLDRPMITYKAIQHLTEDDWRGWLDETARDYGLRTLSLVGRPSTRAKGPGSGPLPMSLSRATQLAAEHPAGFALGGVAIAERHGAGRSESERLHQKARDGCRYFVSQAIYHPETMIRLLADYAADCRRLGVPARRIVLTFVPCGRAKTLEFIRWLGIRIDPGVAAAILGDPAPLSRSIAICRDHLRAILDQPYADELPLGIHVESVSIYRDEIDASIELAHALREVAEGFRRGGA